MYFEFWTFRVLMIKWRTSINGNQMEKTDEKSPMNKLWSYRENSKYTSIQKLWGGIMVSWSDILKWPHLSLNPWPSKFMSLFCSGFPKILHQLYDFCFLKYISKNPFYINVQNSEGRLWYYSLCSSVKFSEIAK